MNESTIKHHHDICEYQKAHLNSIGISGQWNHEPNRLNWVANGLDCMLVRHPSNLHWCGYVGVKPGHKCFGKEYAEIEENLEVHGGLTYSSSCNGHVCHQTDDPEDKTWWLGFDCAHAGDLSPFFLTFRREDSPLRGLETYRDMHVVREWTEHLAEQLT